MSRGQRISFLFLMLANLCLVAFVVSWWLARGDTRLYVSVANRGPTALRGATVSCDGQSHLIGDLAPGQSRGVHVQPGEKSMLEIGAQGPDGQSKTVLQFGPVSSGDTSALSVLVQDGEMVNFTTTAGINWRKQ